MSLLNIHLLEFDCVSSTNDYLKAELTKSLVQLPLAVLAREQTTGRGRGENKWVSLKDKGLYFSLLDRFDQQSVRLHHLRAALLTIAALEQFGLKEIDLKWPNDLLYRGHKVGGILVENILSFEECYSIIGIGVNLTQRAEDFPANLRTPPISMRMITGKSCLPGELSKVILGLYRHYFYELSAEEVVSRANNCCRKFRNCRVVLIVDGEERSGIFSRIGQNGGLIIDQQEEIFFADTVWFDSEEKFF